MSVATISGRWRAGSREQRRNACAAMSSASEPASVLRWGCGLLLILLGSGRAPNVRALCLSPRAAAKTTFAGSYADEVDWVGQVVAVYERPLGAKR
jgi:hypothetical protein